MGNATAEIATAEDSFRLIRSPAVSAAVLYALAWHWQPWSVSSDRRGERERQRGQDISIECGSSKERVKKSRRDHTSKVYTYLL